MAVMRRLVIVMLVAALAGCGWHLRGSAPGAASLDGMRVVVDTRVGEGQLVREVRRALRAAGADVRDGGGGGPRLVLEDETTDRQRLVVGSQDAPDEYELRYRVRWSIRDADGDTVAGPDTFEQLRTYRRDRGQVLGGESREDALLQELRRDIAFLLTERVQATVGE